MALADNTVQGGADTIATDDVTTLNGSASSGVKVERVKVGFGDDATYRDASDTYPLPVAMSATTSRQGAYSASATIALSTQMATLAAAAYCAPSAAIDNSAALDLYDDLELVVSLAATPVVNTLVEVYIIPSIDGTNYADASSTVAPSPNLYVGGFPVRAVTTAQRIMIRGIPIPPGSFKYQVRNGTAVAFTATAAPVLRRRPYLLQLG